MKRALIMLALVTVCAPVALASQGPNQKKGFNANDVYQFNGLDTINAFNGNLTLSIPIGPSFSVGGGLSYGLTLYSNANLWEAQTHCHDVVTPNVCVMVCPRFNKDCAPWEKIDPTFMYPHRRANAGLGWTLNLGRLYQPEHPAMPDQGHWTYESADGADHVFEVGSGAVVSKTIDGSYLRMTYLADDPDTQGVIDPVRKIEFPNGTVQIFQPPSAASTDYWGLRRITNGFPQNFLKISYGPVPDAGYPDGLRWTLEDSHGRKHWIDFKRIAYDGEMRLLVKRVQISRFHDDNSSTAYSPAAFEFNYLENQTLSRGEFQTCTFHHPTPLPQAWQWAKVPLLSSVDLPDGLAFGFTYNSYGLNYAGVPGTMTLPTGGMIEWEFGPYYKPGASVNNSEEAYKISFGVTKRKFLGKLKPNGTRDPMGTWVYEPSLDYQLNATCDPNLPIPPGYCNEFKNTIIGPLEGAQASKTVHYFSVATMNLFPPWNQFEYGLPFTKNQPDGSAQPRWLSSQVFGPNDALLRSNYVRYNSSLLPSQAESSRVVYEDDSGKYIDSDSSDFDGFGNYRTVKKSGTVPNTPVRTTKTNYLPANGTSLPYDSWIRGLYDSVIVEENGKSARTDFCFDTSTGFLTRKRARKDAASTGANDLLAVFVPDARGNVEWERYYGGDILPAANRSGNVRPAAAVGTEDICSPSLTGTLVYELKLTRVEPTATGNGSIAAKYTGVDVNVSDVTIDRRSGLVSSSRDTAGVTTSYEYDWAGRVTAERPVSRAATIYEYLSPTSDEIKMSRTHSGSTEPLPWSKFQIDAFGRAIRETSALPNGGESVRYTAYNALGWSTSTTEPNQPSAQTSFVHDSLGRTTKVTAPDGSITDFEYSGERQKVRKSRIWTGGSADTLVSVTEAYDGFGRLISVTEPSGTTSAASRTGAAVTTDYKYDLADRLVEVVMNRGSAPLQRRLFDYDGRGFLRWESQPEAGITSYLYDARGHLATKLQGAAQSQFDLDYFYDSAERLVRLEARNPLYGAVSGETMYRPVKTFQYSGANGLVGGVWDLTKGKLQSASRYNYSFAKGAVDQTLYRIEDQYEYLDAPGRQTGRRTIIYENENAVKTFTTKRSYNELDLPVSQAYPSCTSCGVPPGDWDRDQMIRTYDVGRLETVPGFLNGITYWPNGLRKALQHSNGSVDTQTVGVMPRPSAMSFTTAGPCVAPTIVPPPNQPSGGPGQDVYLTVSASGTAPLSYQWYENVSPWPSVGTTPTVKVNPQTTRSYTVTVTNPCGEVSATVDVGVGSCVAPKTGVVQALKQADNSWLLKASPKAEASASYEWKRMSDLEVLGHGTTLALGEVSQTTTYRFWVADVCGSAFSTVTITVPLPMSTTGLVAGANANRTKIMVTWPAVAGATAYRLVRRGSDGSSAEWSPSVASFEDSTASATVVYAYAAAVSGGGTSNWSNIDLATRGTFVEAVAGAPISVTPFNEMLRAVNAVRAIANWPAVTWQTILSPSDPVVGTGQSVMARQLLAARARMAEAFQAVGVPVKEYTNPEVAAGMVKASDINEVQQRVQ